jgi:hypothetical protein
MSESTDSGPSTRAPNPTVLRTTRLLRLAKLAATTLAALVTTAAALGWL